MNTDKNIRSLIAYAVLMILGPTVIILNPLPFHFSIILGILIMCAAIILGTIISIPTNNNIRTTRSLYR